MITFSIKYYCKAFFQGRPLRGRREVRQVGAGDGREDEAHELPGDGRLRGRCRDCEVSYCIRIIISNSTTMFNTFEPAFIDEDEL